MNLLSHGGEELRPLAVGGCKLEVDALTVDTDLEVLPSASDLDHYAVGKPRNW